MFEKLFSRRKGYTSPPVQGNLEELTSSGRTRLWNIFYIHVFKPNFQSGMMYGTADSLTPPANYLFRHLWTDFLGRPVDEYPGFGEVLEIVKARFLDGDWHCAFDVLEMVFDFQRYAHRIGSPLANTRVVASLIKEALEAENTAYTFLDGLFVERMTPQEVESVETALQIPIEGVRDSSDKCTSKTQRPRRARFSEQHQGVNQCG
jgi:AbiJ N-terminal domain 4